MKIVSFWLFVCVYKVFIVLYGTSIIHEHYSQGGGVGGLFSFFCTGEIIVELLFPHVDLGRFLYILYMVASPCPSLTILVARSSAIIAATASAAMSPERIAKIDESIDGSYAWLRQKIGYSIHFTTRGAVGWEIYVCLSEEAPDDRVTLNRTLACSSDLHNMYNMVLTKLLYRKKRKICIYSLVTVRQDGFGWSLVVHAMELYFVVAAHELSPRRPDYHRPVVHLLQLHREVSCYVGCEQSIGVFFIYSSAGIN